MADHSISRISAFNGVKLANTRYLNAPGQSIYSAISEAHSLRSHFLISCAYTSVKLSYKAGHNQSHSRYFGRIELVFSHRWSSEQFPSTQFTTWLGSTRGTGLQTLSQECHELGSNPRPHGYEACALTTEPLDPIICIHNIFMWASTSKPHFVAYVH